MPSEMAKIELRLLFEPIIFRSFDSGYCRLLDVLFLLCWNDPCPLYLNQIFAIGICAVDLAKTGFQLLLKVRAVGFDGLP